jgi:hypothetical protein
MCILKCCVFAGQDGQMGRSNKKFKGANEEFVCVRVQGEITSKGGKDQGATTDYPRGLRRKVRTSYEKTPYLDHGYEDHKMTQIKGAKSKMSR